jgi:hypothetical protein
MHFLFFQGGLVRGWKVRPWRTVVGSAATEPVRPR